MAPQGVWEFDSREGMQLALAGSTPRTEYEAHRDSLAAFLVDLFALDGSQLGFEVGSGEGLVARRVAAGCRALDCADISQSFLDEARRVCAGQPNVRFHRIGTDWLGMLPSDSYDFGYSLNVFIHFNPYDVFQYLVEANRLLKPGGQFFFSAAAIGEQTRELFHYFAAQYRDNADPVQARSYMQWIDMPLLQTIVAEAGLIVRHDRSVNVDGHIKMLVQKGQPPRIGNVDAEAGEASDAVNF